MNVVEIVGNWSARDVAIKLALVSILEEGRVTDLMRLFHGSGLDVLVGDPGWSIERKRDGDAQRYEDWPSGALFNAHVDPQEFYLDHPGFSVDAPTFIRYVATVSEKYHAACNDDSREIRRFLLMAGASTDSQ